jgi:ABC-2 type transport system permease protein
VSAAGGSLRRIGAMARKEWMHLGRDRMTLYFAFLMPVALLVLFGLAVSFDVDRVRTIVVDEDHTAESRSLISHLFSGRTFVPVATFERAQDVEPAFRRRQASVGVVIPRGFSEALARGETAHVQVLVDAADNATAGSVLGYVSRFAVSVNHEARGSTPDRIEARVRTLYNPGMRSALFLVPGLIALIQSMMGVLLTALTVAREWERGSMEQLLATPVGRLEIVLGKLVVYFVIGMGELLLVLTAGTWLFDVPVRGSLVLLFGISSLFVVACLGQGLLISTVTRNQMVATQLAAVTSMLPATLLSGLVIPIDNMPKLLQWLTLILPARHFVAAIRGVFLRDAPASSMATNALALTVFALVMLAASTAAFRKGVAS